MLEGFTYDACGNQLTAGTTRNYVWNAGNQLVTYYNQVGSADPTIFAQYDYSGMNRVSKLVKTGTSANPIYERTIYIDGIFEYHLLENGTTYEKNYVHIMDDQSRIAMVRIGTPFPGDILDAEVYNLEDQIGSSTIRLNNNGGIIDKEEYYPFGDSSFRTFAKKRYRYVGKEKDLESGLYYYGARFYAAWTCRFISVDPLASDYVHLTPYNNAGNKPINSIDIDGLQGATEQESGGAVIPKTYLYEKIETPVEVTAKRIPTDQVSEKAKGSGWTRFWGGVQAVVGIVLAVAASVAIGTGAGAVVGVPLLAYSADLAAAGINQAATGEYTNTFFFEGTKKTAKGLGASEETANNIAIGTDIVVGAALTGGSSNTKYIGTIPKVVAGGNVVAKTVLKSFDDVVSSPKSLWGKSADEVGSMLGEGWRKGTYGSKGTGWKFTKGDQSIFYHPGSGRHGGSYYGFSSGKLGKNKIVGSDYKPLPGDKATIINSGN